MRPLILPGKLVLSLILAALSTAVLLNMWRGKAPYSSMTALALVGGIHAASQCSSPKINLSWHVPNATAINNLTAVINATGVYGFQFQPVTPSSLPPTTYDWCNMPHVNPSTYASVDLPYKLEYVEVIHRHHKRTPYAANTFPHETYPWYCNDEALAYAGIPIPDSNSVNVEWNLYTSPLNPFAPEGFNGTCQFPQITGGGLNDSRQHGEDLYSVYHDKVNFLPTDYNPSKVSYRVTNNVITSQVASQLILGMYPSTVNTSVPVLIQPDSIDSLEPTYSCPASDSLFSSYGVGSSAANWTAHLNQSASLFKTFDNISGVNKSDPDWHQSFDHYFDNLSARLCHNKPLPCSANNSSDCVTQDEANAVFRAGEYEYSFVYRDSPDSLAASTSSFGVWAAELSANLKAAMNGTSAVIYRHNVAHDGSVSRLLGILQVDMMVWPGMGAEVVFELYSKEGCYYVRVLWGGEVLRSSNPSLGNMDLVPVGALTGYIDGLVGVGASKVPGFCEGS